MDCVKADYRGLEGASSVKGLVFVLDEPIFRHGRVIKMEILIGC